MQGDDYSSTYPYVGSSDYADLDGGGGGGDILTGGGCADCNNCLSGYRGGGGGGGLVDAVPKNPGGGDYITEHSWTLVGIGSFLIGLLGSTTFFFW